MAGRTPLPAGLKILQGRGLSRDGRPRDSGGRAIDSPPAFRRLAPDKPADLSAEAATHWDAIVPELERLQLLSPAQLGSLTIVVELYARIVRGRAALGDKRVARGPQGPVQHPGLVALRADEREYRAWCTHFGLTPSAESQLGQRPTDEGEENPFR